ncbi:metallophosphoesterase [Jeotgalicoccus huakuii]|uniref:metallophosphoesterase family protein n=2 Tax=Jeotgalicoccus TaxID=227979 RepID=UPI0003FB507E|nr:metallophosphoesterase [Jeotgalicoccus marinus]MCK1976818.1 metallophosphoesterase [Jeotgalicoccus huakuii]
MTKFIVFSDLHSEIIDNYKERVANIIGESVISQPDFIINLGDMGYFGQTSNSLCKVENQPVNYNIFYEEDTLKYKDRTNEILESFSMLPIPLINVLGNHDMDFNTKSDAIASYDIPNNFYYKDLKEVRLVILDTNYYISDSSKEIDYECGNNFNEKKQAVLSDEQLRWLENVALVTDKRIIILSHNPLKDEKRGIANAHKFKKIINKMSSRVICLSGHKHIDKMEVEDNIVYVEINSASYFWQGRDKLLQNEIDEEDLKDHPVLPYIIRYRKPLFAIVELKEDFLSIYGRQPLKMKEDEYLEKKGISQKISDYHIKL